ncbi:MAG TPA: DNA polymerase III subunit delta [Candidatus Dormibacteraeota bacterium]|nr:DNA polymerase III subunit delta [Candidatus Dormibacteraeota bacterium]
MAAPAELLLIHGEERFLVDREARAWLAAARAASASDFSVEVLDAPTRLDGLRRSLIEVPFLDARRHLLVRDAPQLSERPRRGADGAEVLAAALETRAPSTSVCLVAHTRVTAANPVLKAVQRLRGRISEHPLPRGRELRVWLERRVAERRLRLPRGAVDHLLLVVGADLGRMENELDKLAAHSGGGAVPTLDQVRILAGGLEQLAAWDIVDRLLTPPHVRGAAAVDALIEDGVSPLYLLSVVAGQLREVLAAAEVLAGGGGAAAVAGRLGLPPWRAERLVRWAGRVSPELLVDWLRQLQRLDAGVKAGELDDASGLRSFALRAGGALAEGGRR